MTRFDSIYQNILTEVVQRGIREVNNRTGRETSSLPGVHFTVDLEKDGFPILTLRKIPIRMFVGEQIWFIAGCRKPSDFLREYTKIWDIFTNPGDVVTVAYGHRWRKHFGRDQLGKLVSHLEKDPSSRHGVIVAWDPASDGLGGISKKNVPCPFTFTVNIIGGRLHLHNIVRSNDLILGMPADVAGFALLQYILAERLGVKPGIYSHSISNAHIYDNHYKAATELIRRKNKHKPIRFTSPKKAFRRAEQKDHSLAQEIIENLECQYKPLAAIKGLHISP